MNRSKTGAAKPLWCGVGLLLAFGVTGSALTFAGQDERDRRHEQPPAHNAPPAPPPRAPEPQAPRAMPAEGGNRGGPPANFQRPPDEARQPAPNFQRAPATNFERPPNEGGARQPTPNFQRAPNEGGSRPPAMNFERPPNEGGVRQPSSNFQRSPNEGGSHPPSPNFQRSPNEGGSHPPSPNFQRSPNEGGSHPPSPNFQRSPNEGGSHPPSPNFQRPPNEGGSRQPTPNFQRAPNQGGSRAPATNFQRPEGTPSHAGPPGNFQRGSPGAPGARPGPGGFAGGRGPIPSRTFVGHPTPAGGREFRTSNGTVVRTRPGGGWADIRDPRRGMDIHRGMNGNRVVIVNRPDHSRVFVAHGGYGYVQRPYEFHGREFAQRTYWVEGRRYEHIYATYPYHGVYLEVYAPVRYYPVAFYGWAYHPWVEPVPYVWGWHAAPWYGYYGYYFRPYPVYVGPTFWLTDFLIATSLEAAYAAQANAAYVAAEPAGPVLTPEVKAQIADEVKYDVEQENLAAQANMNNPQAPPPDTSVGALLSDGRPHVFVAGSALDTVDAYGNECMLTDGDVVQVQGPPPPDAVQTNAIVLASKGGNECARAATVTIALTDLQEMQNHMRATVDQGMAQLQASQGQGGLPPAPAGAAGPATTAGYAQSAPPPDPNVQSEINAQANAANQVEQQDANAAPPPGESGQQSGSPPTISLGQTPEQVTAAVGEPTRIINLGPKFIYVYPDMKVIFENGVVSDVQ